MSAPWIQPAARILVIGGLLAGVVLGADRLSAVGPMERTSSAPERVAATSVTSYCPGNPFAGGVGEQSGSDASAGNAKVTVSGSVAAHAAPDEVLRGLIEPRDEPGQITLSPLTDPLEQEPEELPTGGPASVTRKALGAPVQVRGTQDHAPGLLAAQVLRASGQGHGLALAPCTAPTADAWLIGGGDEKGRQERLSLVNPGGNAVTAQVDVLAAKGGDAAQRSVVVPARGRSVILLDAIGGTDSAQAVHVTSTGGLVVPTIIDHHLDGLTPAGVETATTTSAPAKRQVIPAHADGSQRGIVLAAPGKRDAVVEVQTRGSETSRSAKVTTVPAGGIVDVDLPKGGGVHSLVVTSDEPIIAAAHMTSTGADDSRDMAWSVATPPFGTLGGVALPVQPDPKLRRFLEITGADGDALATVLRNEDGKMTSEEVTVKRDRSTLVPLGDAQSVWVRPTRGQVHAGVLLIGREGQGTAQATSVPVLSSRVAVRDIEVIHQR